MALHETLHIYMSFHLKKDPTGALTAVHKDASPQDPACQDFRVVGDRSWPLGEKARVREREEERFCVFSFFSVFFFLSFYITTRQWWAAS